MGLNPDARSWPERVIRAIGLSVAWLTLAMVIVTFAIVVLRYGFNEGWVAMQESVTYLHAAVFMLAAAWALQEDGHVRVDIFYRDAKPRTQAWVNLLGTLLFLAPFCVFMVIISWPYVMASWGLLEGSREAGGIAAVYLLKSLLLALPLLLLVQGACLAIRSLRIIRARKPATA